MASLVIVSLQTVLSGPRPMTEQQIDTLITAKLSQSPYERDRALLLDGLRRLESVISKVETINSEQQRTTEKVNRLLEQGRLH